MDPRPREPHSAAASSASDGTTAFGDSSPSLADCADATTVLETERDASRSNLEPSDLSSLGQESALSPKQDTSSHNFSDLAESPPYQTADTYTNIARGSDTSLLPDEERKKAVNAAVTSAASDEQSSLRLLPAETVSERPAPARPQTSLPQELSQKFPAQATILQEPLQKDFGLNTSFEAPHHRRVLIYWDHGAAPSLDAYPCKG